MDRENYHLREPAYPLVIEKGNAIAEHVHAYLELRPYFQILCIQSPSGSPCLIVIVENARFCRTEISNGHGHRTPPREMAKVTLCKDPFKEGTSQLESVRNS